MYDGIPKYGRPRSEAERKKRHERVYGKGSLPRRGTGKLGNVAEVIKRKMEKG